MAVEEHRQTIRMTAAASTFARDYPAEAASVRPARDAVAEFAVQHGIDREIAEDVRLAVSEAATNAVVHAYARTGRPGSFRVTAVIEPSGRPNAESDVGFNREVNRLRVTIEDDGCGLNRQARTPGLGAGLRVMRSLADEAQFSERQPSGTTVQLHFSLTGATR